MAIAVPSRLWLGGVALTTRDKDLISGLLGLSEQAALEAPLLVMADGLSSYVDAVNRTFRRSEHQGRRADHGW